MLRAGHVWLGVGLALGFLAARLTQVPVQSRSPAAFAPRAKAAPPRLATQGRGAPPSVEGKAWIEPPNSTAAQAIREQIASGVEGRMATASRLIDEQYRPLWTSFGIPDEMQARLRVHLLEIADLKFKAYYNESGMTAAAGNYRIQMGLMLGDRYEEYAAWEDATWARREYKQFQDYLRREAIAEPGSTEAAQIVEILRQSEAYSRMTKKFLASPHPFEPNPDVISESPEAARARGQRELEVLRNNVARVLDNASRQGVPETTIEAIRSYYSGQITAHERSVAWLEPDQIQLRTLAGAIAALEKSPSPNVRILEAYRAQKAELEKRMTHAE